MWGSKAYLPSCSSVKHQEYFHKKLGGSKGYQSSNTPSIILDYCILAKKGHSQQYHNTLFRQCLKKWCSYSFRNEFL